MLASDKKGDTPNECLSITLDETDKLSSSNLEEQCFHDFLRYVSRLYVKGKIDRKSLKVLVRQAYAIQLENQMNREFQRVLRPQFDKLFF